MTTHVSSPPLRRNALANIVGRVGSVILWIAVTPFALRHLGTERFGIWSLFFVLSGSVATLDLGMWAGVSRFVALARARGERRGMTRTIARGLTMGLAIGAFWGIVCALGRGLFVSLFHVPAPLAPEAQRALLVFAGSFVCLSGSMVMQGALSGLQRLDLWNLCFMAGLIVNATTLMIGLANGQGLMAAALAALLGPLVASVLAGWAVRVNLARSAAADVGEPVSWRELLGYGVVVQASNALSVGQFQAGKVILGMRGQLVWVTPFDLGFRVANALWSLTGLAQMSVVPAAAHASATGGTVAVRAVYEWCCRWVFAGAAFTLGLLWLTAPPLFHLWLGPGHIDAVATARWLAIGCAIATIGGPATAVARGHGWPGLEAVGYAAALAVNVPLAFLLVPVRHAPGAAIAMAVSFLASSVVITLVFHRRLGVPNAGWLGRWVLPRFVPAALLAFGLEKLVPYGRLGSRPAALLFLAAEGAAFTMVYVVATWPTRDAIVIALTGREWVTRLLGRGAVARGGAGT